MKRAVAVLGLCILSACGPRTRNRRRPRYRPATRARDRSIKAIDHHAHPVRPASVGEAPDTDYDALPVESLAPQSDPIRMRADSAVIVEAHKLFSGKNPDPVSVARRARHREHVRQSRDHGPGPSLAAISLGTFRRCADVPPLKRLAHPQLRSAGLLRRRRAAVEALLRRSPAYRAPRHSRRLSPSGRAPHPEAPESRQRRRH